MNEARALLSANDLNGAINSVISHVKAKPTDMTARTFLFELLIFAGEFDRAEKQLDVLGQQDANSLIGTQIYRQCIACEKKRQKVFTADAVPEFITAKPAYVQLLLDAVRAVRNGNLTEAREKLEQSETERPAVAGNINSSHEFQDFRDYNDLTASVLEVFLKGEYIWLPLEFISKVEIQNRKNLRDIYWTQAAVEMKDGSKGEIHIPSLYVNSFKHNDNLVKLGRSNDWLDAGEDILIGAGPRLFWFDGEAKPFNEIDSLEFLTSAQSESVEEKA